MIDLRLALSLTRQALMRRDVVDADVHLLLGVADHFEPDHGQPPRRVARARVARWVSEYPRLFRRCRDHDGRPPRHTFFYPIEEYNAEYIDALAELCRRGFGEVEVHLHHDNDTAPQLRQTLEDARRKLAEQHGLLATHRTTGAPAYGFIHGNWALANSHPDGHWCGVDNELDVLRETGCYADFTMPSAPHPTQARKINSIYYARHRPGLARPHDVGVDVGRGVAPERSLMLIQGPLGLHWRRPKWGVLPRIENGCLQASQPPDIRRLPSWLRARVQVAARPDWFFVKLHCHGAPEDAHDTLLGPAMQRFHAELAEHAALNPRFHYHYVSAREMYNLARAAEAGWRGSVADARNFELLWNGDTAARFDADAYSARLAQVHAVASPTACTQSEETRPPDHRDGAAEGARKRRERRL